ncbi:MAG: hypothetical protein ABEH47_04710 [Haloferacaceae archaeon]
MDLPASLDHESWRAAAGTGAGYLLILALVTLALFVVPFLLFRALGVAG